MMTLDDRISIKGTSDGVVITIGAGEWAALVNQLARKLSQKSAFFKGGRVALAVGQRLLEADDLTAVGALLLENQMTLWAVKSDAEETRAAAETIGVEAEPVTAQPRQASSAPTTIDPLQSVVTMRRTLRSGQSIEHPGHVVVIGDVNPGSKIVAGGDVIIWGRLRGTVQAGAVSGDKAVVCALELSPRQLIIGSIISRSPGESASDEIMPEMAFIQDGQVVAEAWQ